MFLVWCDSILDSLVACETLDDSQGLEETHTALQLLRVLLDLWFCAHTVQKNLTEHPVTVLNESTQPKKERGTIIFNHLTTFIKLFPTALHYWFSFSI